MKKKWTAVIMAIFGGSIGLHRFYLRQPELGVAYIALLIWGGMLNFFGFPISAILWKSKIGAKSTGSTSRKIYFNG